MSSRAILSSDYVSAVRLCSVLDSLVALQEVRDPGALRDVLTNHVLDLLRDLVPADHAFLNLDDQTATRNALKVVSVGPKQFRMTIPILVNRRPLAAIVLERTGKTFTESEQLTISALARMASIALENASHRETLEEEVRRVRRGLQFDDRIAGESQAIEKLKRDIKRVAVRDTTVLIMGESGTGKELVARSIHGQSPRANASFIAINCAALTETLLESELFGHEKGAFTGAAGLKRGLLETAQGGTVFLDEIGEMSLGAQAKLLRILQNREMQRVGGTQSIALDVRVVTATNRDLQAAVRKGTFREDLFYRLNVVTLRTPPLRNRPEDILPLAEHFAQRFGAKCGRPRLVISTPTRNVLQSYDWPGNVRELENAIEHAAVLGAGDAIEPEDLPENILERWAELAPEESGMLQRAINSAKRTTVKRAFDMAGEDHVEAAKLLGVHPNYLYRLLKNLNLDA